MKKKITILTLLILVLVSSVAGAEDCYYDVKTKRVKFDFAVDRLVPVIGYSAVNGSYVYIKEIDAEAAFTMPKNAASGEYVLSAMYDGTEKTLRFRHINDEAAASAIAVLSQADSQSIADTIRPNISVLGISQSEFETNKDTLCSLFYEMMPEQLDAVSFWNNYHMALLLSKTKGKTDAEIEQILSENEMFLGIESSTYQNLTDGAKEEFYNRFYTASISEKREGDKLAKVWLVLAELNDEDSWYDYGTLLTENATLLGIDVSNLNSNSNRQQILQTIMATGDNSTTDALKTSIASAIASNNDPGTGGGSGGAGGGGAGGGNDKGESGSDSLINIPATEPVVNTIMYSDLKSGHWAYDAIIRLSEKGIISGTDGKFYPDKEITRAEFSTLIANAFYKGESNGSVTFVDVSDNDWFAPYVSILAQKGIISGVGDGKFAPYNNITRQDMAVLVSKCIKDKGLIFEIVRQEPEFTDGNTIAKYAEEAVDSLYRYGVISGMPDGSFKPYNNLSRAEAAIIIYSLLNR